VGYQEMLTDPCCIGQMVVMTYPLIGNYGMTDEDNESKTAVLGGLIVREYNDQPSNFRYTKTLSEEMEENHIPGISGVDTRKLTRSIRDGGSRRVIITSIDTPTEKALETIRNTPIDTDLVAKVSCKKRWYSRTANPQFNVVAVDCGIKLNIIRCLNKRGCNVTIVPYNTGAEEIAAMHPDGIFISNGPGNPADNTEVIALIRALRGKYPIFGLCPEAAALAYGASVYKMKFGHCGGNHPVKNLATGKIDISAQGHSYAVDADSLNGTGLTVTHVNVLDQTVEGVCCADDRLAAVDFHPESAPGPQDSVYLFDEFITMMKEGKANA